MADPAVTILGYVVESLRLAFDPKSATPPLGGGTPSIRLVGGDGIPQAYFHPYREAGCSEPLVWVRLVRRYYTELLPEESGRTTTGCARPAALTVEAGVLRCSTMDPDPPWTDIEREALTQLDDGYRVDAAMRRAMKCARDEHRAHDTYLSPGEPWGPHGGVIAWTQWVHVQVAGT